MITKQSEKTVKQSEDFPSTRFGIKETGLSHIFNVLRNQLYSDKVLAVIREYSCNAVDAHVEVGKKDTPIEVALPNKLSLYLKIRDFGRGLTDTEISEIYAMYGESTKRGTNEQIGQLGLGCKSAFAYGDNFLINSFVDGTKTSYNAFIDPSEIGQISKLSSSKTNEPNGVEIVVPVKQEDCDTFYRKAVDLFKYFRVTPKITGIDNTIVQGDIGLGDVIIKCQDSSQFDWAIYREKNDNHNRRTSHESCIVMGNISYPLDKDALDIVWNGGDEMQVKDDLLDSGLVIRVNIGDLHITANRESLEYTKSTKAKIHSYLEDIVNQVPALMGKKFENCKTLWEAKSLYYDAFRSGGFGDRLEKIAKSKGVIWNGIKVKDAYFRRETFKESEVNFLNYRKQDRYGTKKRVKAEQINHIVCDSKICLVEDDCTSHVGRLNRICPLVEEYDTRGDDKLWPSVLLVTFGSPTAKAKWIAEQKFDGKMIKLSSLPKVKLRDIYPSNGSVASNSAKSTKHTSKEFVFNFDYKGHSYDTVRSNYFTEDAIDIEEGGVYIGIDKFFVMNRLEESHEIHPHSFNMMKENFEKIGLTFPKKVHAFKKAKWDKIEAKENWVCLFDILEKSILEHLEENNVKQDLIDFTYAESHYDNNRGHRNRYRYGGFGRHEEDTDDGISSKIIELFMKLTDKDINKVSMKESPFWTYYNAFMKMSKNKSIKDGTNESKTAALYSFCNDVFSNFFGDHVGSIVRCSEILKDKKKNNSVPSSDLKKLNKRFFGRYPVMKYVDDNFFNGYQEKPKKLFSELSNYINIVDVTFLQSLKDNIFLKQEEVIEQKKRVKKSQKSLDTKPTVI